jgi:hypothetical protein
MTSRRSSAIGALSAISWTAARSTFRLDRIDPGIFLYDWNAGFRVALDQRAHRLGDCGFGEPAHLRNERAKLVEFVVEGFDGMAALISVPDQP